MKIYFTLLSILFVVNNSIGQINNQGVPFITNYKPNKYEAAGQNWDIVQDNRGVMYFGNNDDGVLEYDGVYWRHLSVNNKSIIRSLAVDSNGVVYVGAINTFGQLIINNSGKLEYKQYIDPLDSIEIDFGDVWKTYSTDSSVFFCTEDYLFDYNNSNLKRYKLPEGVVFSFNSKNGIILPNFNKGLMKINNGEAVTVNGGEFFKEKGVYTINSIGSKQLIGTYPQGLFFFNSKLGKAQKAYQGMFVNSFVKDNQLYSSCNYKSQLLLGTIFNGVLLIDSNGVALNHYNKSVGLQDETIINLYSSNNQNIWLALNDGISKIEQNSAITKFNEKQSIKGAVLDICSFNDKLFIATSHGVFYKDNLKKEMPNFTKIEGIKAQTWSLLTYNYKGEEQLLVGSINGLFSIKKSLKVEYIDKQVTVSGKLSGTNYIQKLYRNKSDTNEVIVAVYNGAFSIKYDGVKWSRIKEYLTDSYSIKHIKNDDDGCLWFCSQMNGCINVSSNDNIKQEHFSKNNGLPSNSGISINIIDRKVIAGTQNGLYELDTDKNIFKKYLKLPDINSAVHFFNYDSEGNIWLSLNKGKKRWVDRYLKQIDGTYIKDNYSLKRLPNEQIEAIFHDKNGITWLGSASGLYCFDSKKEVDYTKPFNTLIREVLTKNDSILFYGSYYKTLPNGNVIPSIDQPAELVPELLYYFNDLTFEYAAPYFIEEQKTEYSYQLFGYSNEWSSWTNETKAAFTNLNKGEYIFKAKAKNIYGIESSVAQYRFVILAPWYQTIVAYILYVLMAVFLIIVIVKIYTRRLEREKIRLEGIVQERTSEIRKQRDDIEKKNEVLQEQKEEILKQKEEITSSIQYAQRIQRAIVPSDDDAQRLLKDYFLLWKPRDIVSGDFWWLGEKDGYVVVTAADCTGHGVPGAFMSMLGVSFLNEIVNQQNTTLSNEILNRLREKVKNTLGQTAKGSNNKDGMDMALLVLDFNNMKAQFSGAYNPLYLYRNGELTEVKATRNPISVYIKEKPFKQNIIDLQKGDTMYLFSDGYPDQFGGDNDKKYSTKRFKQLLLNIHTKPMNEQKQILDDEIRNWCNKTDQIDDIIILGIRV